LTPGKAVDILLAMKRSNAGFGFWFWGYFNSGKNTAF
jgi:hypothetical protein